MPTHSNAIAIIPARGGSQRIPRKNLRPFLGQPILHYSISAALNAGCFDTVMVSTDDTEIAHSARQAGADVPFLRSASNADEHATLADAVGEVLAQYAAQGHTFEYFCCILATAPFLQAEALRQAFSQLQASDADSVFPVVRFDYPIQRALRMHANQQVQLIWPEHAQSRSNDLEPAYHDAGLFYWMRTDRFHSQKNLLAKHSLGIELPAWQVQDIDTEADWQMAELKYRLLYPNPAEVGS